MGCRFPPARFPFVSMCVDLIRRRLRLGPILGLAALGFAGCDSVSPSRVPTAVAFLTQPAGASGGTPFTTQPVVEVLDQNDERLAGTAVSVTVGLGSNPSGGQLLGVTTVITTTGLAAFGDLTIDKAGTGYTLVVSVRGAAASSAGFDVMVGPAKRLRFLAQPGGGLSATPLAVQPVVEVVDAGGNRETNQSRDVTLSFGINPTAALLTGTVALASTSGLATFTDVAISRGGTGYRLIASAAGLAPDTSQALDVDIHFVNITVSTFLGCGLAIEGDAYCWGRNELGGLGVGFSGPIQSRPVLLAGGFTFRVVEGGAGSNENGFWDGFGCGFTTGGATYCWGRNNFGQLGNGNTGTDSNMPVPVTGGHSFTKVSAGRDHVCALTSAGAAYCWGRNVTGELGNGTTDNSNVPALVTGGHVWTDIDANGTDTCGLTTTGDVYCWGGPPSKLVGPWVTEPTLLGGGLKFKEVSTGWFLHRCGVTTDDDAYCWGQNFYGELGNGSDTTDSGTPEPVSGGLKFKTVQAGAQFSCGLTVAGDAYCWGRDAGNGTLGQGSAVSSAVPLKVVGGLTFESMTVGSGQTCGVTPAGVGYCWGSGFSGERGDGTLELQGLRPVRVRSP